MIHYLESREVKPWKEEYELLKERLLLDKRPFAPWILLDCNGTVRLASRDISKFGYDHDEIKDHPRPFWQFFARDIYKSYLCELSSGIDAVLARDLDFGTLQERLLKFRVEHRGIRKQHGIDEKVHEVDIMEKKIRTSSAKETFVVESYARVLHQNGVAEEIDDKIHFIYGDKDGRRTYLGAMVVLGPEGVLEKFKSKKNAAAEKDYHDRVDVVNPLIIDRLTTPEDVQAYASKLPYEKKFVIDFKLAPVVNPVYAQTLFLDAKAKGIEELLLGSAGSEVKHAAAKSGIKCKYARFRYPSSNDDRTLTQDIERKLNELGERIRTHANPFPKQSVPSVPSNPERPSDDVQASR